MKKNEQKQKEKIEHHFHTSIEQSLQSINIISLCQSLFLSQERMYTIIIIMTVKNDNIHFVHLQSLDLKITSYCQKNLL
jgi:hypothetical protein